MKKGEIFLGPPVSRAVCSLSIVEKPPIPEPIWTPKRGASSEVIFYDADSTAN